MLRHALKTLYDRSPVLTIGGGIHAVMLVITTGLMLVDDRVIMGINGWIKPMKFMVSITIYLWTLAWLVGHLEKPRWAIRLISWGVVIAMVVETVCLFIQARRGTTSHYNIATAFDSAIFSAMGAMIALDTVLMIGLLILFFRKDLDLNRVYLWGIRLGIAVFLVGSWVGGQMIANNAHTVGAPDGGPGLFFVNWSTIAGDLRIAHAMGLHGLQVLPVVGYLLAKRDTEGGLGPFVGFAAIYVALVMGAFLQAKAGVPLVAM